MSDPDDPRLDRRSQRGSADAWSSSCRRGVVVCAHYRAADAGAEVLRAGGNAADAAVAAALALNVCEPAASGLGGMAMILCHGFDDGAPTFYDGACVAPADATPAAVAAGLRYRGHGAVAVPGAPAAWAALHRRHGRLPFAAVVEPARALARGGVALTPMQHELIGSYRRSLRRGNACGFAERPDGQPREVGDVLVQPALAETLAQLAREGLMGCYRGEIGRQFAADMAASGGFVTERDLHAVEEPEPRAPIEAPFGAGRLYVAGPPAGGLALAQLATMVTRCERELDLRVADDLVFAARMIQRVRVDRRRQRLAVGARSLGAAASLLEPAVVDVALGELAAGEVGAGRRDGVAGANASGETSHLCVVDADGATVSMTLSIERSFGAARLSPALGYLYNGYLRGFKVKNRRHPHYLRPGAPARSNAAPTILLREDGGRVALGSTGSERMVSGIFQTLLRLRYEAPFDAVAAPRVHATPEGALLAEWERLPVAAREALAPRFDVEPLDGYSFRMGGLQLAIATQDGAVGVADPRRDGAAAVGAEVRP